MMIIYAPRIPAILPMVNASINPLPASTIIYAPWIHALPLLDAHSALLLALTPILASITPVIPSSDAKNSR